MQERIRVVQERIRRGKPWKRFKNTFEFLGQQLVDDPELRDEVMEEGAENWLRTYPA